MQANVLWFEECNARLAQEVGGKCSSLGELLQANIPVPPGFAVTTGAYAEHLSSSGIEDLISDSLQSLNPDDGTAVAAASAQIRGRILAEGVPTKLAADIGAAYSRLAKLSGDSAVPVAVRSSATAEDLPGASFAGQHETQLWVRGLPAVLKAAASCWASLYDVPAVTYRLRMGIPHRDVRMSVGVQRMVPARAAGVMFTLDPVNGDRSQVVIEAAWGLGEAVVNGEVTPDRFHVDKVRLEVTQSTCSAKWQEYVPEAGGGVLLRQVEPARAQAMCLTVDDAIRLATVALHIEHHYGCPQDIEWALDDSTAVRSFFILQSRPETVWSRKRRPLVAPQRSALGYVANALVNRMWTDQG